MKEIRPIRPDIDLADRAAQTVRSDKLSSAGEAIPGILEHAILFRAPRRLTDMHYWHYHIPFAFLLMALMRPRLLVELGTHKGDSYCAFCQAVDELALPTSCYAIDTWQGDIHTRHYGDEVLQELRSHHDGLYSRFSTLLQMTFDEGVAHFGDESIDLLHIDGTHTYESVKHDWETWLPKLSDRAVMLMHDTNVRESNFGVWQLWQELAERYPSREFKFGNGLGILAVGARQPQIMKALFELTADQWTQLESVFFALGNRVTLLGHAARLSQATAEANRKAATLAAENSALSAASSQYENRIVALAAAQKEYETSAGELRSKLAAGDAAILELHKELSERDGTLAKLQGTAAKLEETIGKLTGHVAARDAQLATAQESASRLNEQLALKDKLNADLNKRGDQLEGRAARLNLEIEDCNRRLADLQHRVTDLSNELGATQGQLHTVLSSNSWVLTKPLRFLRRAALTMPDNAFRRLVGRPENLSDGSSHLRISEEPIPTVEPEEPMTALAEAPQEIVRQQSYIDQILAISRRTVGYSIDYVPKLTETIDFQRTPVNVIAFYLPQFHPIPENDKWWGKGFTEWTNVSKAVPQYVGHYQPHLPGELGFYDLRLVDVMRQQADLARQYGIGGFCFHYYWFAGKRLLELPVRQFLESKDIDLPFCLCWANENWTRRWDGSDSEILIAQKHSPEDHIAFIDNVIPMFKDPRYIRFGGRPVLIVYRASLLPEPAATARRWRERCIKAGVGDPYLVVARSFDIRDPRPFGFDAALEFPPHQLTATKINDSMTIMNPDYRGSIYDYNEIAGSFAAQSVSEYPVIKTVMPSWDNEARKPGAGHTFHGASPAAYAKWLRIALAQTQSHIAASPEAPPFLFINAWNEWAEGAHLEPDRRYGYAYLHATANLLREISPSHPEVTDIVGKSQRTFEKRTEMAVIAHVHYDDLFPEILEYLRNAARADIFISLRSDISPAACQAISEALPEARLAIFPNRGRDMYPFLEHYQIVAHMGYKIACKIHAKRSPHRPDGNELRQSALEGLLGSKEIFEATVARFRANPTLGLLAPKSSILRLDEPKRNYHNAEALNAIYRKANFTDLIGNHCCRFVAGSMFWFRVSALKTLSELNLTLGDFEDEVGQVDGTLAHCIERTFALFVERCGFAVEELS